mmetsp:Transcript_32206/g.47577  ORF Transcript_32206/g.47577 Transcript_32206/m.47577 type:complete len:309 (-) Transcript_32206:849-1775(-)
MQGGASFTSSTKGLDPFGKSYTSIETFSRLSRSMSREPLPDPKKDEISFRRMALMLRRTDSIRSFHDSSESLDRIDRSFRNFRVGSYSNNRYAMWANPTTTTCQRDPSSTRNADDTDCSFSGGSVDGVLDYWTNRITFSEVNAPNDKQEMRQVSGHCDISSSVLNTLDEDSESNGEDQSEAANTEKAAVVSTSGCNIPSEVDTLDKQLQQISEYATSEQYEAPLFIDYSQDEQSEPETQSQNSNGIDDSYNLSIRSSSVCETTGCNDAACQSCYEIPAAGTPRKNSRPRMEDTDEDNISSFAPPLRLF